MWPGDALENNAHVEWQTESAGVRSDLEFTGRFGLIRLLDARPSRSRMEPAMCSSGHRVRETSAPWATCGRRRVRQLKQRFW